MTFRSKRNILVPAEFETEEQRDLYDYIYEESIDHESPMGKILWGTAMYIAGQHPDWTFWQVVAEVKRLRTQ